jgi:hypothetical protein
VVVVVNPNPVRVHRDVFSCGSLRFVFFSFSFVTVDGSPRTCLVLRVFFFNNLTATWCCVLLSIHGLVFVFRFRSMGSTPGGNICPVPSSRSHSTATCMKMIHFRTRMMRLPVRKPMFQGQCLAHDTIVKLPTRCCSAKPRRTVDPPVIRDLMRPYERPARRRRWES